jgi:hypothetical protein
MIIYQDNSHKILLDVNDNTTILEIKYLAQDYTANHPDTQNLYFKKTELLNDKTISSYNLKEFDVIHNLIKKVKIDYTKVQSITLPNNTIIS